MQVCLTDLLHIENFVEDHAERSPHVRRLGQQLMPPLADKRNHESLLKAVDQLYKGVI